MMDIKTGDVKTEKMSGKKVCFFSAVCSFLIFYAMNADITAQSYGDYFTGELMVLLQVGSFAQFLLVPVFFVAVSSFLNKADDKKSGWFLSAFLSGCLLVGRSYGEDLGPEVCFGSKACALRFILALVGFSVLIRVLIWLAGLLLDYVRGCDKQTGALSFLFGKHAFIKCLILLLIFYMPFVIYSYPGNMNWDAVGQLWQVFGQQAYSSHHPLFTTVVMGNIVKFFYSLTGKYSVGLFVFLVFQTLVMASSFAYAVVRILDHYRKEGRPGEVQAFAVLAVFCLAPIYSNLASTVIKDVLFIAAVVHWFVRLLEYVSDPSQRGDRKFTLLFMVSAVLVILLRNNGLYVILVTGICFIVRLRRLPFKELARCALILCLIPVITGTLINNALILSLKAEKGSVAEALCLPFQQSALCSYECYPDMSAAELEAYDSFFGGADRIGSVYYQYSGDPVKARYYHHVEETGTVPPLTLYIKGWAAGLVRHPVIYLDAFCAHVYGWFWPEAETGWRYYVSEDAVYNSEKLVADSDEKLIRFYSMLGRFAPLSVLENPGAYTWVMFILLYYLRSRRRKEALLLVPLFTSLLICMASPMFYEHPRYALPYMATLPVLIMFCMAKEHGDKNGFIL